MAAIWVSLVKLEEIMGRDAARVLATLRGGNSVYVGHRPSEDLTALCGGDEQAAAALCSAYGGSDIVLPSQLIRRPPLKERIMAMVEAGASTMQIVQEVGCTSRYISEIRRNLGRPDQTRRTPMKGEILRLLKARRKVDDQAIAEQTGASVAYVGQLRSALRRGMI